MANITRWNPLREMINLRDEMDRLYSDMLGFSGGGDGSNVGLALDVTETDENYVVKAAAPGMEPDDLDISLIGNTLTIRGETKAEETREGETYHLRERRFGRFSRSITLPRDVDTDDVDASYERGILTICVPKTEEVKPRRIDVRSGAPSAS